MTQNVFATTGFSIPWNGTTDTYNITITGPVDPGDVITLEYDGTNSPLWGICNAASYPISYTVSGIDTEDTIKNQLITELTNCDTALDSAVSPDTYITATDGWPWVVNVVFGPAFDTQYTITTNVTPAAGGDVTPPSLTVPGNFTTSSTGGTLSGTVSDVESGISAVNVEITDPLAGVNTYSGNVVGGNWDYNYALSAGTGTYNVLVTAVNGSGLTTTWAHTITLNEATDVTTPVVTIVGANPQTIVVGGTFSDSGAEWADNGNTGAIALGDTGSLNLNQTGSYSVTYTYADLAGNTGSQVRTVNVVDLPPADTNAPTLSINGGLNANTQSSTHVLSGTVNDWENTYPISLNISVYKNALLIGSGQETVVSGNAWSHSYSFLNGTGTYTFSITATDGTGNVSGATTQDIAYTVPVVVPPVAPTPVAPTTIAGTGEVVNLAATGSSGSTFQLGNSVTLKNETSGTLLIPSNTVIEVQGNDWDGFLYVTPVASGASENATFAELPLTATSSTTYTVHGTTEVGASGTSLAASGGLFDITVLVPNATIGAILGIYRSNNGASWIANNPDATCTVDGGKNCNFKSNHLSYFTTVESTSVTTPTTPTTTPSNSNGNGGGGLGIALKNTTMNSAPAAKLLTQESIVGESSETIVLDSRETVTIENNKFTEGEKVRVFIKDENGKLKQVAYVPVKDGKITFKSLYQGKFVLKNFKPGMKVSDSFFALGNNVQTK